MPLCVQTVPSSAPGEVVLTCPLSTHEPVIGSADAFSITFTRRVGSPPPLLAVKYTYQRPSRWWISGAQISQQFTPEAGGVQIVFRAAPPTPVSVGDFHRS